MRWLQLEMLILEVYINLHIIDESACGYSKSDQREAILYELELNVKRDEPRPYYAPDGTVMQARDYEHELKLMHRDAESKTERNKILEQLKAEKKRKSGAAGEQQSIKGKMV